jgi:AraC-like DNA-binding protein
LQRFAFSTDHVAPGERFAFWSDTISRRLTGMTMERLEQNRATFWAKMTGARFGGGSLLSIRRTGDVVHRADSDIRRQPGDDLLIYRSPGVASWFRVHGGEDCIAGPGAIVIGYADVPFSHAPVGMVDYQCLLVSAPTSLLGAVRRERGHAPPRVLSVDRGLGALLRAQLDALHRNVGALSEEAASISLGALAQGSIDAERESAREAIANGQIAAAERLMARSLHRPDLTPEVLAGLMGISARRLHELFEPTGLTFSKRLRRLRLERARALLADEPARPVTDVAFCCGFDSLPTFYRTFKSASGMTATEWRLSAIGSGDTKPTGGENRTR